jgi:hypothetical protein
MFVALPVTTVIAQAAATASPAAAANAPTDDAAVAARAKDWLHQIETGKIDRSQLDDRMNAALTDDKLAQVSAQLAPLGDPASFMLVKKSTVGTYTVYVYKAQFAAVTLYESFSLDPGGKIGGLYLSPQAPPT